MFDNGDDHDETLARKQSNAPGWRRAAGGSGGGDSSLLRYRAEVRRREPVAGHNLHLYDGGDCSPYCIESLIDLLRSETRATRQALDMTFEILDACSGPWMLEVAQKFAVAGIPGLRITVRARGRDPVMVDSPPTPAATPSPKTRTDPPS